MKSIFIIVTTLSFLINSCEKDITASKRVEVGTQLAIPVGDDLPPPPPPPPVFPKSVSKTTENLDWMNDPAIVKFPSLDLVNFNRQAYQINPSDHSYLRLISGLNIPDEKQPSYYMWNSGDTDVGYWLTQGITGSRSTAGSSNYIAVSWYYKDPLGIWGFEDLENVKGARITFVNMETLEYRHVLLVQNKDNITNNNLYKYSETQYLVEMFGIKQYDEYIPVPIHAGGIAWVGNYIYVASTSLGVRVFDIRDIFKTEPNPEKDKIGIHDGKAYAFNYGYALPQSAYYDLSSGHDAPYSSISLERRSNGELFLWTGQYIKSGEGYPYMGSYKLNTLGDIELNNEVIIPKDNNGYRVHNTQGVFRYNNTSWVSRTGASEYKNSTARLVGHRDGDIIGERWRWPHGAEDLYYDEVSDELWSNTEFPGSPYNLNSIKSRVFFKVKFSEYYNNLD